tara:strand:- start:16 stop:294 length:279 start_codon:yes stop_codon:yes gene_type:complete
MKEIIENTVKELNEVLPKEKKLTIENETPLIDEKSKLESIDLVNLFVILERNLKNAGKLTLTFDEMMKNIDSLKTIGSLENFLVYKEKNEKN